MAEADRDRLQVPVPEGGTVERIVRHLSEGISQNRYAPGQRLIEADLTRDLGVSRGPVREAFRRLSAEGLIAIVPNRGAEVRRLTFRQAQELFQIRAQLEGLAVRLAAAAMADPVRRAPFECAIAPIWSETERLSTGSYTGSYIEENRLFHEAIMTAGDNRELIALNRRLQLPLIMSQISHALTAATIRTSIEEHRTIANAILAGNGARAARLMRAHLERAAEVMEEMPADVFRKGEG